MVKEPIMTALLEADGYDSSKEDLGSRYLHCGTLKAWRSILRSREDNKPKVAGELLDSFDDSQWEKQDFDINSWTLRTESQHIGQLKYLPLGMDLEYLKKNIFQLLSNLT